MNNLSNFQFFTATTSTGTSNVLTTPNRGDTLTIEVYGTATAFSLIVQGIMDANNANDWTDLGWYNTVFEKGTDITAKGIYTIPIYSILKTQVIIESISGGNLTVFGKVGE